MGVGTVETVGIAESGVVETEDVYPLVMKIGKQLCPRTGESLAVQMPPDGQHHWKDVYVGEMILNDYTHIVIDGKNGDSVQLRQFSTGNIVFVMSTHRW